MQKSRREFVKKAAMATAGTVVGTSVLAASGNSPVQGATNNGVVKGSSNKKEILYKQTATWEEYYKGAK